MEKRFDKLVRDKIIDQIKLSGREVEFKILSDSEFILALEAKLEEELVEYKNAKTPEDKKEELADLLEVIMALTKARSSSPGEVDQIQKLKRKEKGGFKKRHFLIKTQSK